MPRYKKTPISKVVESAEGGNVEAKASLGLLHELGLLQKSQLSEAAKWFEDAAQNGDGSAAISAAEIYRVGGLGLAKDAKKADELYKVAAKLGYTKPESRVPKLNGATAHQVQDTVIGRKVLIVDKAGRDSTRMNEALSNSGFRPTMVHDFLAAKNAVAMNKDFECFFVELDMGGPSHMQVLDNIRKMKDYKKTPIVVVTTITDINVIKKAKQFGIHGWVLKPVKDDVIINTAKKLVT